ncbi:DNA/RNA nuclease SfsA [Thalassotalea marina]|uniref:Sugar fermentation stimulation protein homolog n=1 Tax=Thalassotalea marina TaxID=1673741 RepID=A0A919BQC6_9GAMM|nr:DNA/RNA nuclease SfsA [Thalassotalea marina]GHG04587.1 sugar fermentation stimulation protein [Thalassotalea marina]
MELEVQSASLIKRYKRFLADITLDDGTVTTIHCANTGAMTGCAVPGDTVLFSTSDNKKRKYPCSWEITKTKNKHYICVNTIRANQLIEEALIKNVISSVANHSNLKREVKYGEENSKADFYLTDNNGTDTYIEVKSVTLLEDGHGFFPDAKTLRGQKHLRELTEIVNSGKRAILLFAVLHSGINEVSAAAHIDPEYAVLLNKAHQAGVEIYAYKGKFEAQSNQVNVTISHQIPVKLSNHD